MSRRKTASRDDHTDVIACSTLYIIKCFEWKPSRVLYLSATAEYSPSVCQSSFPGVFVCVRACVSVYIVYYILLY